MFEYSRNESETKIIELRRDLEVYRSGQVRSGQVRSGQVRSGQVRSGQVRSGQVRSGQVRSGQVRSGQVRSGQVRSGQVRSGQVRSGQVRSGHLSARVWTVAKELLLCGERKCMIFCGAKMSLPLVLQYTIKT